jgi:hypothetical protein
MGTKHIYLIKHGETEENLRGIHRGRAIGGRLSERGRADIRKGIWPPPISPRPRCSSARCPVAASQPNFSPPRSARVTSGSTSAWPPRTAATLGAGPGSSPPPRPLGAACRSTVSAHPGGESSEDVQARYVDLWDEVHTGSEQTTVLVGHGGGIACLLLWLTGSGFDQYLQHVPGSAGVTWVEVCGTTPRIRLMNASPADLPGLLDARTAR